MVRRLPGLTPYDACVAAMRDFTATRGPDTPDELWLLQHPPVYTLGLNTNLDHVISAGSIPVVQTDRGGQVTYHGPGQLVAYPLLDLQRAGLGIRQVVSALEDSVIELVAGYGITASARREAPGVYVAGAKLASIGLRVRRGCTYHGLALNVALDLAPFAGINPCGYPGLPVTSLELLGGPADIDHVGDGLAAILLSKLGLRE
ncbi:MAG: lipoyl(octanoyl) transferase LipB [Gammaproteobacteria bacterium]